MSQRKHRIVIAIDGSSASGKGTIADALARHYEAQCLHTGQMYRLVALYVLDGLSVDKACDTVESSMDKMDDASLSDPKIAAEASRIASVPRVRERLSAIQRRWINDRSGVLIVEGRDIGTEICPDADVKIFLTASVSVRAERRLNDLRRTNPAITTTQEQIMHQLEERDLRDRSRALAPLKQAHDAQVIDSSNLSVQETLERAVILIDTKIGSD